MSILGQHDVDPYSSIRRLHYTLSRTHIGGVAHGSYTSKIHTHNLSVVVYSRVGSTAKDANLENLVRQGPFVVSKQVERTEQYEYSILDLWHLDTLWRAGGTSSSSLERATL